MRLKIALRNKKLVRRKFKEYYNNYCNIRFQAQLKIVILT